MKKKQKNKYDPKIEMVKYLNLIDRNKIWLIFNTASKVFKFPGHASSYSIFNNVFTKFHISKVQTLNLINLKFEQNCYYIGGVDTYTLKSVAILLNIPV